MAAAGATTMLPDAPTIPIYWSILTVSAPITFQTRVDEPLELRLLLNSAITGGILSSDGATALTVVTAELVTVPEELVALMVYTVDVAGDIALDPAALTTPIPWSILTVLAPVTSHTRFDVPPGLIVDGLLLKVPITEDVPDGGVVGDAGI
ncbi:MAG: hypothetical protein NTZ34_07400 [Chloroflexi bacterium]|nr:hypothetical protein [Chloroflexota bacterium]